MLKHLIEHNSIYLIIVMDTQRSIFPKFLILNTNHYKFKIVILTNSSRMNLTLTIKISFPQDDNGSTQRLDTGKLTKVSKVSPDGSSKVLLSWLESLPKSDVDSLEPISPPSPHTSHNNSIDSNINTINRRNQTLTRTNPYRHKVCSVSYGN